MNVIIEKQKDGTYLAYNKDGNGVSLIGEGNTVSEAKDDYVSMLNSIIAIKPAAIGGKLPDDGLYYSAK